MPRAAKAKISIIDVIVNHFMSAPIAEARTALSVATAIVNLRSPQDVPLPFSGTGTGSGTAGDAVSAATASVASGTGLSIDKPRRPRSPNGTRKPRTGGRKPRHSKPLPLPLDGTAGVVGGESLPDGVDATVAGADVTQG